MKIYSQRIHLNTEVPFDLKSQSLSSNGMNTYLTGKNKRSKPFNLDATLPLGING